MGTAQVEFTEEELLADLDGRRAAHRRRRPLPRRLRRGRQVRLAADQVPPARHRGLGRAEQRALLHRADRRPTRMVGALVPQRRAGALPHPRRRARAADGHTDPDRDGRGIRRQHPAAAAEGSAAPLRRGHRGARPSITSAAGCSRRTAATRRAGTRRRATRTCGSPPATSPSSDRARSSTSRRCWPGWDSVRAARAPPTPSAPRRHPARARDDGLA